MIHSIRAIVFYLFYGNIFVALAAASMTYVNARIIGLDASVYLLCLFVFFATLLAYNFQRLIRTKKAIDSPNSFRLVWIKKNARSLRITNIISAIAIVIIGSQLSMQLLFIILPSSIVSTWYVISYKRIPALREVPYIKLFVIGLIWGLITLGLPYLLISEVTKNFIPLLLIISFYVVLQTIPFDIRDSQLDRSLGIKTIAQKFGIKRSKFIIVTGFILLGAAIYLGIVFWTLPNLSIVYAWGCFLAIPICSGIKKNSSEIYYSFVVESILFFPFLLLFLKRIVDCSA